MIGQSTCRELVNSKREANENGFKILDLLFLLLGTRGGNSNQPAFLGHPVTRPRLLSGMQIVRGILTHLQVPQGSWKNILNTIDIIKQLIDGSAFRKPVQVWPTQGRCLSADAHKNQLSTTYPLYALLSCPYYFRESADGHRPIVGMM